MPTPQGRRRGRGGGVHARHQRALRLRRLRAAGRPVFPRRHPGRDSRSPWWRSSTTCATGRSWSSWRHRRWRRWRRSAAGCSSRVFRLPVSGRGRARLARRPRGDAGVDPVRHQRDELHRRAERARRRHGAGRLRVPGRSSPQAQGGWFVYFAALLLAAGLAGFLPFNFPRARIFMGDVGSQFCGFVLAVLGVAASRFDAVEMSFLLVPCC